MIFHHHFQGNLCFYNNCHPSYFQSQSPMTGSRWQWVDVNAHRPWCSWHWQYWRWQCWHWKYWRWQYPTQLPELDKPARLIIRLLFWFASDSLRAGACDAWHWQYPTQLPEQPQRESPSLFSSHSILKSKSQTSTTSRIVPVSIPACMQDDGSIVDCPTQLTLIFILCQIFVFHDKYQS